MPNNANFFDRRTEGSEIKSRIVLKYFAAWANVIVPSVSRGNGRVAYIDLFAGPGRYKEGAASTPLLVLEKAISRPELCERLVTIFNDADSAHSRSLEKEILALPNISNLRHRPHIVHSEVGPDWVKTLGEIRLVPTFSFVDPCGYKGLSKDMIRYLIRDWGCDCLFFFNYRRINAAFDNDLFKGHVDELFGADRAQKIREKIAGLRPWQRDEIIHAELAEALREAGGRFVLPFTFKNPNGNRTTHSLIFVSKHEKAFEIMKEVMAPESSVAVQGVPSFVYSPADKNCPMLELDRPLDRLQSNLMDAFAGKTIKMRDLYRVHHVHELFIKRNYRDALLALESRLEIATDPSKRRQNTFGDDVSITFPLRSV